jgi:hypothetical protein
MDSSLLRSTGWAPAIGLQEGLSLAYADYLAAREAGNLRTI